MVTLRAISKSDYSLIEGWTKSESLKDYWRRFPPPFAWLSPDTFLQLFQLAYVIEHEGKPVGLVNLANVDAQGRKAEFGLMVEPVGKPRQAIAVEALKQLFDHAFLYSGLNKIYAIVRHQREDLKHLLTKYNFKHEGTLRDNAFFEGKFHDEEFFGLLRHDYEKLKERK